MPTATGANPRIESYLARVRTALHGLPESETEDILRELRSHVVELAGNEGSGVEAALRSLGDPVDLAKTYRAENQMVRAECSRSPLVIVQGVRHASRTRWGGVAATSLYAFGYINVLTLWAAGIEKLFAPSHGGLWYTPGNIWSLTLVTGGDPPAGARELLGWWLVPIALIVGWLVRYVTDRIAQWWIGRYRRSKASRES
jgi:HAAS domain-containing protein